ncbi:MAG TPA: sigma-70 family RNA polymerase sigma factor [Pseudoxanthomonas sp.]|nr:sigma-70 family RNA polymerase sigma factor [Pseudoxanthomonas sp.]
MARDSTGQAHFRELIECHRGIVFKVANTYSFQPDNRADLAQEITAQLWRAFPGYDAGRPFSTWMYRIALNVAISQVRSVARQGRHSVPLDETLHDVADENATNHETDQQVRALHRFIAQLDTLNRALLLLYLEDQSYREIAEILGISETNVATKLSRLKQRIRNEI